MKKEFMILNTSKILKMICFTVFAASVKKKFNSTKIFNNFTSFQFIFIADFSRLFASKNETSNHQLPFHAFCKGQIYLYSFVGKIWRNVIRFAALRTNTNYGNNSELKNSNNFVNNLITHENLPTRKQYIRRDYTYRPVNHQYDQAKFVCV